MSATEHCAWRRIQDIRAPLTLGQRLGSIETKAHLLLIKLWVACFSVIYVDA